MRLERRGGDLAVLSGSQVDKLRITWQWYGMLHLEGRPSTFSSLVDEFKIQLLSSGKGEKDAKKKAKSELDKLDKLDKS